MEKSANKLAEMEVFHYANKIRTPPRHIRTDPEYQTHRPSPSAHGNLPADVIPIQLHWSLQM